jgi:RecA-family ATPase
MNELRLMSPDEDGIAPPPGTKTAQQDRRLVLTPAAQIKPRPVLWGWEDRMPAGHLSLIPGREGIGKSLFLVWLTAQITRGTLPGAYYGSPRPVFYCAAEDSWQCTIVPRMIAARADLDLVYRVDVESAEVDTGASMSAQLTLPCDCDLLAAEIKRLGVAMVALDPLMSTIDEKVDTYNDRDMRTVLEPLGRLAETTGCMIAGLAHFNKSADLDPMNRVTGSRAFTAFVRAVIAIARDPDDEHGTCIVSQVKNNLGRLDLPNLTYVIQSATIETDEGDAHVGRLQFTGESEKSVRDILAEAGQPPDRTERAERAKCAEWLEQALVSPRRTREIEAEADAQGFRRRTLVRARKQLGVRADQLATGSNKRGEWWLSLPASGAGVSVPPGGGQCATS